MAAWLPQPVTFHSSRAFTCDGFTPEDCAYYQHRWHFWYEADHVFALPTVAFFTCVNGVFILAHLVGTVFGTPSWTLWRKTTALARFLSYRGWHVRSLRWNTASLGVLLLGAVGTVYFFCMTLIPRPYYWPNLSWGGSPPLATRSGWLALGCMPFIFATASKTNPITLLTGISHEKLHVFHRWISYAFLVLALFHTFPFIIYHIHNGDMVMQVTQMNVFEYWTGIVALVVQGWLTFASWGPFRRIGYEFFKATHFLAAVVFMLVFFWHCAGTLTSWDYFLATAAIYVPCLLYSWLRTLFEYGATKTKATVTLETNGFLHLTIPSPSSTLHWLPGQHCFLRFHAPSRTIGLGLRQACSSHPFTICSVPAAATSSSAHNKSELVFYIRPRSGITAKLHAHALNHPGTEGVKVGVWIDGPYGGIDPRVYDASDRVVVVAGGSGAGWMLAFVEHFLRCRAEGVGEEVGLSGRRRGSEEEEEVGEVCEKSGRERVGGGASESRGGVVGPRSLRVILATRDVATRAWFEATVRDLRTKYGFAGAGAVEGLSVEVYLTGETEEELIESTTSPSPALTALSSTQLQLPNASKHHDPSITSLATPPNESLSSTCAQALLDRPNLPSIIRKEAAETTQAGQDLSVYVCGPLSMQDDARNAVAAENLKLLAGGGKDRASAAGGVYLHLEHFSWA